MKASTSLNIHSNVEQVDMHFYFLLNFIFNLIKIRKYLKGIKVAYSFVNIYTIGNII